VRCTKVKHLLISLDNQVGPKVSVASVLSLCRFRYEMHQTQTFVHLTILCSTPGASDITPNLPLVKSVDVTDSADLRNLRCFWFSLSTTP